MTDWWRSGVVYSMFVPSLADGNGDGVGDLTGVRSRLEYLKWLGVDCVWLSPVYRSPMLDAGYDIADFCAVDPLFGTEAEFDALLTDVHALGIKLAPPISIPGFRRRGRLVEAPSAIGTSGPIPSRMALRPTTGSTMSINQRGRGTRRPDSNITGSSSLSSQTSISATRKSWRPWKRSSASGWIGASMACASMRR